MEGRPAENGAGAAVPPRLRAGTTFPDLENVQQQYPEKDDMTAFRVRQLGYVENNRKDVSGPALYAPFGRDLLTLPKKRYHMGELLELPELPPEFTDPIAGVPPYLILNVMLPNYDPSMLVTKVDGPGWAYVFYFVLTQSARSQLADLENASAAVRTLVKFITVDDPAFRERLKLICMLCNIDETKFSSMVKRGIYDYNMKPFLTRPQHKFFRGPNYFEIDLDVHEFSYLPKKVWASIRERVDECQVDIGLTIEGRDDSELPELILAQARVDKYGLHHAVTLQEMQAMSDEARD
eukprot:m.458711 g.458711  ORF g.458711 m.458711 type:complete len:294 (+) comp21570_c0_seq1:76-957(+)